MKSVIFFGSDGYSAVALNKLIEEKVAVSGIVTTPPKPKGRDGKIEPNEIEKIAVKHSINYAYYPNKDDDKFKFIDLLKSWLISKDTIGVSASFGRIISNEILELFNHKGIVNIHPSLLPQYRNVAPVPYAIAMGDTETGVTIFRIGEGIDNGEILGQSKSSILPTDSSSTLLPNLFLLGAGLILDYLAGKQVNELAQFSPSELIFTRRLTRESGFVEWPAIQKLIAGKPISSSESANPLIQLRLSHFPDRSFGILQDLCRALEGWEKVWTEAETKKGKFQISLTFRDNQFYVLIAGKPKSIPWSEFAKYYL